MALLSIWANNARKIHKTNKDGTQIKKYNAQLRMIPG